MVQSTADQSIGISQYGTVLAARERSTCSNFECRGKSTMCVRVQRSKNQQKWFIGGDLSMLTKFRSCRPDM